MPQQLQLPRQPQFLLADVVVAVVVAAVVAGLDFLPQPLERPPQLHPRLPHLHPLAPRPLPTADGTS